MSETDVNNKMAARGNTFLPSSNTEEPEKVEKDEIPKRVFNGWTPEQERLYADWNEIASCCRWIHIQVDKIIYIKNVIINIPIIILSGVSRTIKIMVQVLFENTIEVIKSIKVL